VGVAEGLADAEDDGWALAEPEAPTDAEAEAEAVAETAGTGVAVIAGVGDAATTPTMNWPPASMWKWTDWRFARDVCALVRICRASVKGAALQAATSVSTARAPAAAVANDLRRDT
jgi:hypothetical protein